MSPGPDRPALQGGGEVGQGGVVVAGVLVHHCPAKLQVVTVVIHYSAHLHHARTDTIVLVNVNLNSNCEVQTFKSI